MEHQCTLDDAMRFLSVALRPLKLPVSARNPRLVAARLRPAESPRGVLVWVLERGVNRWVCISAPPYQVKFRRVRVTDSLSGLTQSITIPEAYTSRGLAWRGVWQGTRIVVGELRCDAVVRPGCRVECLGFECEGLECLEECIKAVLGAR